uniref:Uncharacterized protein n=1 Tax=Physcomitrium patens TaxID=3218 RepID=A0A2K1IVN6_PHYPA|nr:hypothetical protein PHYPA_025285 [Physcomitrium patens]
MAMDVDECSMDALKPTLSLGRWHKQHHRQFVPPKQTLTPERVTFNIPE